MNKEKAEFYAKLYARAFLITETVENNMREDRHYWLIEDNRWWLFEFSSGLLDQIYNKAKEDLTKEEFAYFEEETESPNRYDYE